MQTTLEASLTGILFMQKKCNKLLKSVKNVMITAEELKETHWSSERGIESLVTLKAILDDCQTIIVECRSKKDAKGGLFTNKKKWSRRFEGLESRLNELDNILLVSLNHCKLL